MYMFNIIFVVSMSKS